MGKRSNHDIVGCYVALFVEFVSFFEMMTLYSQGKPGPSETGYTMALMSSEKKELIGKKIEKMTPKEWISFLKNESLEKKEDSENKDFANMVLKNIDKSKVFKYINNNELEIRFNNLQRILANKNYEEQNTNSSDRDKEIHRYSYLGFYYLCDNYEKALNNGETTLELTEILDNFIEAVEVNNGITIVHSNGKLLQSDKEGQRSLDDLNAVGVAYGGARNCIYKKMDSCDLLNCDLSEEGVLDSLNINQTLSTLVHELTHNRTAAIKLKEDDISTLGFSYEVDKKYSRIKSTFEKMLKEGMAVSYGNMIEVYNSVGMNTEIIEKYFEGSEVAAYRSTSSYPVFNTLFKNFQNIFGADYFECRMEITKEQLTYLPNDSVKEISIADMKKRFESEFGEDISFEDFFEPILDILEYYQEYTEKIWYVEADFPDVVKDSINGDITKKDAINRIYDTADKTINKKIEAIIKLEELLGSEELLTLKNSKDISKPTEIAINFQKTVLNCFEKRLEKLRNNKADSEKIKNLFLQYRNYKNNTIILVKDNDTKYDEETSKIEKSFFEYFCENNIEIEGYKFEKTSNNTIDFSIFEDIINNNNEYSR